MSKEIVGIYFLPPMAIARLGGSPTPLESFTWIEDPNTYGAGDTVIQPTTTLEVDSDGTLRAYLPSAIRFRDGDLLRPAAPFFELWTQVLEDKKPVPDQPLTSSLLAEVGASLQNLKFVVTVVNRKAARRTGDPACSFGTRLEVVASDHARKPLLASSPHLPHTRPLVANERPIPLGLIQIPRPVPRAQEFEINLDVIRLRFTPAKGEVYGPSLATAGIAPVTERQYVIIRPENRMLNPDTSWTSYDGSYARFLNPEPSDTYDGAGIGNGISWGIVDDTCDGTIDAILVIGLQRFQATARIFVGPPDYAPDRRPFVSLADDLVDRDHGTQDEDQVTQAEIADLFQRIFETVSLTNLDNTRSRHLRENRGNGFTSGVQRLPDGRLLPAVNNDSMTDADRPFARRTAEELPDQPSPQRPLRYVDLANSTHAALADVDALEQFLRENAEHMRLLLRPPYGSLRELPAQPPDVPQQVVRDPRVPRDRAHDMRMPPYMRDSDASPLSLTRRQYRQILTVMDRLVQEPLSMTARLASRLMQDTLAAIRAEPTLPGTDSQQYIQQTIERRRLPSRTRPQ